MKLCQKKKVQLGRERERSKLKEREMYLYRDVLPFTVMVVLECANVVTSTLFKAATDRGMSYYVFIVYSYALSSLLLLPSPLFYRRTVLPPLSCKIIAKLFLLGLIGSASLLLGYKGIEYGSPTLASAISNLVPAFTFTLAILFRMEKLAWRSSTSQAKILGTMVCITGAIIVILYKGPSLFVRDSEGSSTLKGEILRSTSTSGWLIGGLLLGATYILISIWYILMAHIINEYPAQVVVIFFNSFVGAIICGAVSSITEPNRAAWVLKPDVSLIAVVYSGIIGSGLSNSIHAWVLHQKGPFYIAMFKPLSIVIAASMGVIFLGDVLHLGSIIGSVVISMGFYAVMWGKAKEENYEDGAFPDLESSSGKTPLLKSLKAEN